MKKIASVVAIGLFALAVSPVNLLALAAGQTSAPATPMVQGTGGIAGTAVTSTATPLGEATVQLLDKDGKPVQETKTKAAGIFVFSNVPAGTYTVNIVQTFLVNGVTATTVVGVQTVTVVAGTIASVTVTTTAAALAMAGAAAAGVAAAGAAAGSAAGALILTTGATAAVIAAASVVAVEAAANTNNDASPSS